MTTDITTTTAPAVVEAAALSESLRQRAGRIVACDRAAGAALLAKSRELRAARREAAYGQWKVLLQLINMDERDAQRHIAIAERADTDKRFEEAVLSSYLPYSTAYLATRADDQLLSELLELPEPPSRRQLEAMLRPAAAIAAPEAEEKPDTGVGFDDDEPGPESDTDLVPWAVQRLLLRRWTTDTQIRSLPDDIDYIVRDSESGERWVVDAEALVLVAQILDQEPQISSSELFDRRLAELGEPAAVPPVAATKGEAGAFELPAQLQRLGCTVAERGHRVQILDAAGEMLGEEPRQHWDLLVQAAMIDVLRREAGSTGLEAEERGNDLLFRLRQAGDTSDDWLTGAHTAEELLTWLAERRADLEREPDLRPAALGLGMDLLPYEDHRGGARWRLVYTDPEDPRVHRLADLTAARVALRELGEIHVAEPEPPRPIEVAVPAPTPQHDELVAAFVAALRGGPMPASPYADTLMTATRQIMAGETEPRLDLPESGRWPVSWPTLDAALKHAVRLTRAGDHAGAQALPARLFAHEDVVAAVRAAAEAIEFDELRREALRQHSLLEAISERDGVYLWRYVLRRSSGDFRAADLAGVRALLSHSRQAAEGAAPSPVPPELPDDLVAAGVKRQQLQHSKLIVFHRGGMVFASAATFDEAVAQARQKLVEEGQGRAVAPPNLPELPQAQAAEGAGAPPALLELPQAQIDDLVERARACGAEVDAEPDGQRYHVLAPDRDLDEWLTAEQLATRVVDWEAQGWRGPEGTMSLPSSPARAPEKGFGGATTLPAPPWRDDSPRVAAALGELLGAAEPAQAARAAAALALALAGGDPVEFALSLAEEAAGEGHLALLVPVADELDLKLGGRHAVQVLGSLNGSAAAWAGVVRSAARRLQEAGE